MTHMMLRIKLTHMEQIFLISTGLIPRSLLRYYKLKKGLWGGEFWTKGYFVSTVGKHGNEEIIIKYVKNQGNKIEEYKLIHKEEGRWLPFF